MTEFSFDEWARLYKTDPAEFDRKRKEFLDLEISKAPEKYRDILRVLQTECNAIRKVNTPLDATIEISAMMEERLSRLKAPLTQLRSICEDGS